MIRSIHIVLGLFMLLTFVPLSAQEKRHFESETLDEYRKETIYKYDREIEERDSVLGKITKSIRKFFTTFLGHGIGIVLLIGIFILIVLLIIRSNSGGFKREVKLNDPELHEPLDIHQEDWNILLKKALSSGNHRLSVRYLYLISLKLLDDKHLISWDKKKTNHDLIEEIGSFDTQSTFRQLTYIFEYTWYGKFDINAERFNQVRIQFDRFNSEINNG